MLLSPAHTRYHHHLHQQQQQQQQHMEAPNNDAANTLLKRPRLAQCGVATVLYLVLHRFQKPFPLCIVSVSNDRHYTGYVSSRYCQAGPSPPRARHGLHTITPAVTYHCTRDMHRLTSSANVQNCRFKTRTIVANFQAPSRQSRHARPVCPIHHLGTHWPDFAEI